jgi:hypothetical protein
VESERISRSSGNGAGGASAPQRGKAAAAVAGEQGQEVARQARAQTQEVAAVAGDQAREVADLVRGQASQLTQELSHQGRTLYDETRQQVAEQADVQTQALAQTLHRWGSEVQALAEDRTADAGAVGMYARQCADQLYRVASEIEIRGASGLVEEVGDLARRRPGTFLLGAALIGFGGGRLLRSGKANAADGAYEPDATVARAGVTNGAPQRRTADPAVRRRAPVNAGTGRRRNPASSGGE